VLLEVPADGARDGHRRLQRHDGLRVLGLHAVQRLVAAGVVVAFQHVFTDPVPRAGVTVPRLRRRCHVCSAQLPRGGCYQASVTRHTIREQARVGVRWSGLAHRCFV
jgi:hypothetical protein